MRAFVGCGLGIALLLFVIGRTNANGEDVKIIRSDQNSLVVEYTPRYSVPQRMQANGKEYAVFDFDGSIPQHARENAGRPDIRMRKLALGLPADSGNTVQVIAADYEDIPFVVVPPVPSLQVRDEILEIGGYAENTAWYDSSRFLPGEVVQLTPPSHVRSMVIGSMNVFPVQFNPAARTVRKFSRLVIQVVFGKRTGHRVQNSDDLPFEGVLLNYHAAKDWKFETPISKGLPVPSVLASGEWYRIGITEEGAYKLDAQFFSSAGINITQVDPRTIKLYGNGGMEVPEDISQPRAADLVENAIYVEGEGDRQFNSADYVLFYAKATRGWKYSSATRSLHHYINHYTETNYYWLTFGGQPGRRMQMQSSLSDNPTVVPTQFMDGVFVEEEKVNILKSGKDWYGLPLNPNGTVSFRATLPGLVPDRTVQYRYALVARSEIAPQFIVRQNGDLLGMHALGVVYYGSPYTYATAMTGQVNGSSSLAQNQSNLSFTFSTPSLGGTGWLDWVEVLYPRRYEASNDILRFRSPDTTGIVEYQLSQFTVPPMVLNVTDPAGVQRIALIPGSNSFRASETARQLSTYYATTVGALKTPPSVLRIPNQNLRGYGEGAEFIIVTSGEFRRAADVLAAYRQHPDHGNLKSLVVDVNQIYNEFGGGLPDVTAIRDFLKYAYDTWTPRPRYVLMFGQASYDYKGLLGNRSSIVPTWQSAESRDDVGSWSTDDFFAKFGSTNAITLIMGRIASRTPAEADAVVAKLKAYEENSARDPWKMRMLFIGDDSWTPESEDGTIHSEAAERLAEYYTPQEFEKKKIYLAEYPTVHTAQGRQKPGAYQAIIDQINNGVLAVNFTGHGNPTVWTHEGVFSVPTSIPRLTNANKLAVFFAATCNFSQFDDPGRETGSEILLNKTDGGAIGVVSATRKVFAGDNNYLHQNIFANLFRRTSRGRFADIRVATALFAFKAFGVNDVNDQKFFYMGDPTMPLQYPGSLATIDTINQEPVDTVNGTPRQSPIRLRALARVRIQGSVRTPDNQPDSSFNGQVELRLNDASRTVLIPQFAPGIDWSYVASGSTIYRGQSSVMAGRFRTEFIVPKDISYADSVSRGRMVGYFLGQNSDGAGFTTNINLSGADTNAVTDVTGPDLKIYVESRSFREGDLVGEEPMLLVDVADSNGINTSTSGVGHRIEAWINNAAQSKDLTEFFANTLDNFRQGTVEYRMDGLRQGRNTVRVRAWDSYNNASSAETYFDVTSSGQLTLREVMNYPNPFAGSTEFTFRQNQSAPLSVRIKIFTIAGRLIHTLEHHSAGEPFVRVPWDGRDREGDLLANGVYLYKVVAQTADGRFSSESIGKFAVVK